LGGRMQLTYRGGWSVEKELSAGKNISVKCEN